MRLILDVAGELVKVGVMPWYRKNLRSLKGLSINGHRVFIVFSWSWNERVQSGLQLLSLTSRTLPLEQLRILPDVGPQLCGPDESPPPRSRGSSRGPNGSLVFPVAVNDLHLPPSSHWPCPKRPHFPGSNATRVWLFQPQAPRGSSQ